MSDFAEVRRKTRMVWAEWPFSIYYTHCAGAGHEGKAKECSIYWLASSHSCTISKTVQIALVCISYISSHHLSLKNKHLCGQNGRKRKPLDFVFAKVAKLYTLQRLPFALAQWSSNLQFCSRLTIYHWFSSSDLKNWTLDDYRRAYNV